MRLFIFPGLGADERLFAYQKKQIPQIVVPTWLKPLEGESLAEYGKRWAQKLDITPEDYIGGMSFGGQLALEMARHKELKGVLLISANRRASEISSVFRLQTRLLNTLPEDLVRTALKNMAIPRLERDEKLAAEPVQWLREMSESMDYSFFEWSAQAAANWDYEFNSLDFSAPIFQVRGEYDNIISVKHPGEVDTIPEAGHLINYTHPEELNRWISEKIGLASSEFEPVTTLG